MKPIFISIASMALLASATPIISDSGSSLKVRGNDESNIVLDKHATAPTDSNMLDKRWGNNRRMNVPNSVGTAVQNIGVIVVKAIVDAAGDLVFQITNNAANPYQVSLRETSTAIDAATLNVAAHRTIEYDPLGGINPGDIISINTQVRG